MSKLADIGSARAWGGVNWFAAHQVKGLVLRGIFGLRRSELLFFYQEGSSWLFPDAWEKVRVAPTGEVVRPFPADSDTHTHADTPLSRPR
jgi:hypothetical protein